MIATRYNNSTATDRNMATLLRLIEDENCAEIRLFASPSRGQTASDSDGPETNMPLIAALARYEIPGISEVYVVFDGLFMTAARRPRFQEVVQLLDSAQASGKAQFATKRAAFTSSLEPEAAATALLEVGPVLPFTASTRPQYFALLSNISEEQYP